MTGQIGSEATPEEYIAALIACTARVGAGAEASGSLFVNLGDKYAGGGRAATATASSGRARRARGTRTRRVSVQMPNKSLIGLPWRYALGCIDDLGLILRAEIMWSKPNGLPESVTDRVRPLARAGVPLHAAAAVLRGGRRDPRKLQRDRSHRPATA